MTGGELWLLCCAKAVQMCPVATARLQRKCCEDKVLLHFTSPRRLRFGLSVLLFKQRVPSIAHASPLTREISCIRQLCSGSHVAHISHVLCCRASARAASDLSWSMGRTPDRREPSQE